MIAELHQAAIHLDTLTDKKDMRMIKKALDFMKEYNAYKSGSGSPLKQSKGQDMPAEAGHESANDAIVDGAVPQREGKKDRCVSKRKKLHAYKDTHSVSGRKKPSAPDSKFYAKRYKTSRRDRVAQQSV